MRTRRTHQIVRRVRILWAADGLDRAILQPEIAHPAQPINLNKVPRVRVRVCVCAWIDGEEEREWQGFSPPPGLMRRALIIPDVIFRPQTRTMS